MNGFKHLDVAASIYFNPAMGKKRKEESGEPQKFSVGETVIILRPHLWSGATGEVVSFANGLHRIKIEAKDPTPAHSHFHADAPGSELEAYI